MWTEARIELLKELLKHPDRLSADAIARELRGVTRNAVIGKVNRLGLSLPNKGNKNPRQSRRAAVSAARLVMVQSHRRAPGAVSLVPDVLIEPTPADDPAPPTCEHMVQFMDLENHHCRFPLWRDRVPPINEQWYCGAPANVADGRPYCPHHLGIAYQPPRKRTPRPYNKWAEAAE